ncbi:multidrug ABC transporter substrate-binding protein [Hydrogenophaga crassostreae]|uniref:Multidrug ABC transporter substrate-binding protein n=1 Tax=Hydrogenophaga crassostreae TaxID=1763535 RepID=A0A162YSY8_9BURK|nr:ABC transporter permease [Hydrogenophaga crassostreae]AOW12762.1 multidrug ABC transporter substrate-binding protein [Hydrogenophaga crassostreae]OAD39952.1 multidrug ABC transporter substrate-binding protein [Hydrogenophaga crassostreae]
MNVLTLAWRYLWSRPLTAALNLVLLALGLAAMGLVLLAQDRIEHAFDRDLAGIDAVVGAKGSPMQLILSGVFHIDTPTGNVALADVRALAAQPQIAQVIPMSLGDNLKGSRIVGSTPAYAAHYGAQLAQGRWWTAPMEAVLGASVAQTTGLSVGQHFSGAHGLGLGGSEHGDTPYTMVGRLEACGCVLDRLVLTDLASVWQVHEGLRPGEFESLSAEDREAIEADREVTLALIRYASPLAATRFPRHVNTRTAMQAASPALEVARVLELVGMGTRLVQGLGAVLLLVAALSVFIALWNAVRERRADMALLRLLGAPPRRVGAVVLCEALWLALLAGVLGVALAQGMTAVMAGWWMADTGWAVAGSVWPPNMWAVPGAALLVALIAAAVPVISAYRADVAELLTSR